MPVREGSGSGHGDPAYVGSEIGENDFTFRKLFHLHMGNYCFIKAEFSITYEKYLRTGSKVCL